MPDETATFEHFQIARREDGSLFELGRGAMGVTYKAYDTRLDGYVALKVINPGYLNDDVGRERFLREARAAAHLDHPNVAAIFHRGQEGGNYFYAMQFIEGETLDAFVRRRGPLPVPLALRIVMQAAQGLAAANARGLIHRDIKPANLMLVHLDGTSLAAGSNPDDEDLLVKVIDFGLAKVVLDDKASAQLSLTGEGPIGTPYYMSPEQIDSSVGEVDARTDIYSLGVTLWYLLTGQPPFVGTQFQVFRQHMSASPPMARLPATVPENVRALLDRMMAKTPTERPANTRDLIGLLRDLLRGPRAPVANAAPPPTPVDPAPPAPPADHAGPSSDSSATMTLPGITVNLAETRQHTPIPPPPSQPPPVQPPTSHPPPAYQPPAYQPPPPYQPPPLRSGNASSGFSPPPPVPVSQPPPYVPPPYVPGNQYPPAYTPPPTSGNRSSVFPPGPYQPPPQQTRPPQAHGRQWLIFGGVLLGALLLGGIPLGYFVAKSRHDKTGGNDTPPPASVTPVPSTSTVTTPTPPGATPRPSAVASVSPRRSPPSDAPAGARTLMVPAQYSTIQAAINAAKSGDTVKVAAGTYREKLVFKTGIHLAGEGADDTVVSTPGDAEALDVKNCASGTVTDITFEHTGPNKANEVSYVVWMRGSGITMTDCRIRNSGSVGIGCEEGDKSTIENCEVLGAHGLGMRALGAGTAPVFRGNYVHGNTGTGISFTKGASGTAETNVSENNSEFGFSIIDAGTAPVLSGNTVRTNKMSGFTYQAGGGGSAQDNIVAGNKEGGFRLSDKGTAPTLVRNRIKASGLSGFIIVAGAAGTIANNTSEENTNSGALVSGPGTQPTFTNNDLNNNHGDGMFIDDGAAGTYVSNTLSGNVNGVEVNGKGTAPTLRENQIHDNTSDGIAVRGNAGGVFDGNACDNNKQYGIAVYGAGSSPALNNNTTEGNKKDGTYIERGATPKRSSKYEGAF